MNEGLYGLSKQEILLELHESKRPKNLPLLYFYAGQSIIIYNIKGTDFTIKMDKNGFDLLSSDKNIKDKEQLNNIFDSKSNLGAMVLYIPSVSAFITKLEAKMDMLKDEINKEGLNVKLADFINPSVDDEYSEIIFQERITLRKLLGNKKFNYVDLKDLGSGAEKVIKIMAVAEIIKPDLLLIDDFESGLHPSLIRIFLNWLKEKDFQIIISTHSIDALYSLAEMDSEDISILQLKKTRDDTLHHKNLSLEDLVDLLHGNIDPRIVVDALDL